jgi:hypothetical protein
MPPPSCVWIEEASAKIRTGPPRTTPRTTPRCWAGVVPLQLTPGTRSRTRACARPPRHRCWGRAAPESPAAPEVGSAARRAAQMLRAAGRTSNLTLMLTPGPVPHPARGLRVARHARAPPRAADQHGACSWAGARAACPGRRVRLGHGAAARRTGRGVLLFTLGLDFAPAHARDAARGVFGLGAAQWHSRPRCSRCWCTC